MTVIKNANKKDWRKACLTERKANSCFKATNLTIKPMMADAPTKDKNREI